MKETEKRKTVGFERPIKHMGHVENRHCDTEISAREFGSTLSTSGGAVLTREQIREVYGDRLAEAANADGVLKAQPKQIRQSKFGNVIQIATLYVNRDKPNPVVLNKQSVFRVQGKVAVATEIHVGFGAFGTTRASAGRFLASRNVAGEFDVEIPVDQFQPFRGRSAADSAIGMEVFCLVLPDLRCEC